MASTMVYKALVSQAHKTDMRHVQQCLKNSLRTRVQAIYSAFNGLYIRFRAKKKQTGCPEGLIRSFAHRGKRKQFEIDQPNANMVVQA